MAGVKGRSGAKPKRKTALFRDFCRDVITSEEVLKVLEAEAQADPWFALKLAEQGIGRPFQAVHVQGAVEVQHCIRTVQLEDGSAAFTQAKAISDESLN